VPAGSSESVRADLVVDGSLSEPSSDTRELFGRRVDDAVVAVAPCPFVSAMMR
jgi:hypothetical protein